MSWRSRHTFGAHTGKLKRKYYWYWSDRSDLLNSGMDRLIPFYYIKINRCWTDLSIAVSYFKIGRLVPKNPDRLISWTSITRKRISRFTHIVHRCTIPLNRPIYSGEAYLPGLFECQYARTLSIYFFLSFACNNCKSRHQAEKPKQLGPSSSDPAKKLMKDLILDKDDVT